ncbi:MAG: type II toxin-antitoxin system HigB family toxin [Planctomycetes bacterium]|nr:type II toxin-antitoxin system HigB family toxin [Planctomycetota bacterium]
MRVIRPGRVREFAARHPDATPSLERWLEAAEAARWRNLVDVRQVFRGADEVKVASGRTVVVFNIAGNQFRLITAIHYNVGKVFVLMLLTHAEYGKDRRKDAL